MKVKLLRQILKMSRLALILLVINCMALTLIVAEPANGQISKSIEDIIISIDLKSGSIDEIFSVLEAQSNFDFVFDRQSLDIGVIELKATKGTLGNVLRDLSRQSGLEFRRVNDNIVVKSSGSFDKSVSELIFDPMGIITGIVTDEYGDPLPGATVLEKGTTNGTITDIKGNYSLEVSDDASLSISFVGYQQIETAVNGRSTIDIVMQIDAASLEEVVVVGYGSVRRKDLTGSVGSVSADDIIKAPVRSFDEALAGRIAGVQISTDDGQPGALPNIVIRGSNSLTQDNSPLFVIDGFPIEDNINSAINPEDIESIDVLKDASATAIYGARGSNGVIIITTKRGQVGKPVVSYNTYYGFNKDVKRTELLSPYEFVKAQMEIDLKSAAQFYLDSIGKTLEDYRNEKGTDWYELCLQNAASKSHNLSVRGGGEGTKYSVSLSYFDQEGLFINTGFNRYQGRIALDQQLSKRIKAGLDINLSQQKTYGTYANEGDQGSSTLMGAIWLARPVLDNLDLMNEDDIYDLVYDPSLPSQAIGYRINPYLQLQNELKLARDNIILANLYVEYEILKDLKLRVTGGINQTNSRNSEFYNSKTKTGSPGHSQSLGVNGRETFRMRSSYVNENTLSYNKSFSNDHHLNVVVGYTQQVGEFETFGTQVVQISDENLGLSGLDLGTPRSVSASSSSWALMSFLGRINYNYKQKYFFTTTFRSDGSSKFSKGNRWGYFPSAAVAYRISNEGFWNNVPIISDMKIRASYGVTGNNRVSDFAYLSEINSSNSTGYSFGNETPSRGTYSQIGNGDLKWETTKQTNIGLDFSVLQNRVTFIVDYYNKLTDNYKVINNCNALLEAIENIEFQNQENKQRYIGEANFLRSFAYFNLVRLFGKVPLSLSSTTSDSEFNLPRSSVDDVYAVIFDGLKDASEKLEYIIPSAERGRATKGSAQAVLAESYLNYGNYLDLNQRSGEATEFYQSAADYADSVISSGAYSLVPNYADLFDISKENGAYDEVIFGIQFTADPSAGSSGSGGGPFPARFAPPNKFKVSGQAPDGLSFALYGISPWIYDKYTSGDYGLPDGTRDFRMGEIMIPTRYQDDRLTRNSGVYTEMTTYPRIRESVSDVDPGSSLPYCMKYTDAQAIDQNNSGNDLFYLRLAEIYLIKAEALNEISGPSQEALDALNQLRIRARNSATPVSLIPADLTLADVTSKEELRMKIYDERVVELYAEGKNYFDCRRMRYTDNTRTILQYVIEDVYPSFQVSGNYQTLTFNSSTNAWEGSPINPLRVPSNGWEEKWLLFPIPAIAYSLNPGLEGDYNPGW